MGAGMRDPGRQRYSAAAIALHWAIAAAILLLLISGLWMTDAIEVPDTRADAFAVYQWHKSLGLTVLVLSFARLAWRLINPPPGLPAEMGRLERLAAHTTHVVFYVLMIGMPLLGWAMVSASVFGLPTIVFGLFEWPHMPMFAELENKAPVETALKRAHSIGGYLMIALLVLHVLAALKHHFVDRDHVLTRMLPFLPARRVPNEETQ